ncbi:type II secretion system F family protein [Frankia sp. Ag45/Mut15]|uniref:Type II secretion system F family protein n=1 Tax=Frankia umida TaxID=573489 RepID=A0ABT0JSF8_9ACTN|nr:type II secretion system F family protein [Frankia umida]
MGIFLGLLCGLGLFLIVTSGRSSGARGGGALAAAVARWEHNTAELLAQAGIRGLGPRQFVAISAGLGALVGLVVLALTGTLSLAGAFALFAAMIPRTLVVRRRHARMHDLRELWPDVVDNLASAVRAGMSLPEGLAAVGVRGPVQLRPAFTRFGEDYGATGSFTTCLDRLAEELADPIADRIIESLRMAREVGGTDLGRLLRTLSTFLREDARTRAELETRQGWTVNAARLALAAPWIVLLLLATRGQNVQAYDSPTGVAVLVGGGAVSGLAYILMRRIGRLPEEGRVLRGGARPALPATDPEPTLATATASGSAGTAGSAGSAGPSGSSGPSGPFGSSGSPPMGWPPDPNGGGPGLDWPGGVADPGFGPDGPHPGPEAGREGWG